MTGSTDWRAVVRREWLIVTAAVVVAAGVAGGLSLTAHPKAVATAQVLCDQRVLAAYSGVPTADTVVTSMHVHEANVAVAALAGVTPAQVSDSLKVTAVAAPLYGADITVTLSDAAVASRIASAAATVVADHAAALDATQIDRYRSRAALDQQALIVLEAAVQARPADSDLAFKLWSVRVAATDDAAIASTLDHAYRVVGDVSVSRPSRTSAALKNMLAAVAAGLAIGLAIAVVRERLLRQA
jgi:capsular polysaccharide biosynthesis protein